MYSIHLSMKYQSKRLHAYFIIKQKTKYWLKRRCQFCWILLKYSFKMLADTLEMMINIHYDSLCMGSISWKMRHNFGGYPLRNFKKKTKSVNMLLFLRRYHFKYRNKATNSQRWDFSSVIFCMTLTQSVRLILKSTERNRKIQIQIWENMSVNGRHLIELTKWIFNLIGWRS